MITREEVMDALTYDPQTGIFRWAKPRQKIRVGDVAGTTVHGYIRIRVNLKHYAAHRLAWLVMTGEWPEIIDHINGDRSDNRWENLRSVDTSVNLRNRAVRKDNPHGVTGITFEKGKWRARISTDDGRIPLGTFDTLEAAVEARRSAEREHGYLKRE